MVWRLSPCAMRITSVASGYWAEQCAAAGLISIHFVSVIGDPMVAPFRGKDSRFGTNPLCVVFPRAGPSAAAAGLRHQRHRLW
ncbi:malate dehydrogenase [Klebsiella pneumoniae]|uniref:Malate dehydrogenase n=1 Tax=Klebsiella pneumoniae TaxID=573 RepID=A0A378H8L8_KLEPN|nr:malate dehydrogenase [Klebsiella pneumoniae]